MSVPPITGKTGVSGSVAYWKQQATAPQDIALDRLAVTLNALVAGHNQSVTVQESALLNHSKRLAVIETQLAALPWPFSEGP